MEIKTNYLIFPKRNKVITFIMRLFIFFFCTMVFSLVPKNTFSQDVEIKIDTDTEISVDEVFEIIKSQTNYRFVYRADAFEKAPKVKLKKGLISAHNLLIKSLSFGNLYYELAPNRIIILKEKDAIIQQQGVTGVVTDNNGIPLTGVTIRIEGTRKGVLTDFDGNYSIDANIGDVLVFSYLGKNTVSSVVSNSKILNVTMSDSNESLDEVIVTALGIKKEKKAIGYAVSSLKSGAIEDRTEGDFARIISGKVAGLNVTNASGLSGSGTNIVIRGLTSFNGNNQALIVVDGVPFNNDISRESGGFYNNNQTANRAFDIDPNNIESVEVLKGLAAATLYGSQGSNGVILITTKTGSRKGLAGKNKLTLTHSTFLNTISTKPDYQYEYGQGLEGVFDPNSFFSWGPRYQKDGLLGYGTNNPLIDENGMFEHYYSTSTGSGVTEAFPELQDTRLPYKPYDVFDNFFKPGLVNTTSAQFNGTSSDGNTSYNASLGHIDDESFMPGNKVKRTNLSIGGNTKIADRLTLSATMNYNLTDLNTVRSAFDFSGLSNRGSIYPLILAMPRNVNLAALPYQNPNDRSSVFFRRTNGVNNPRWLAENARYTGNTSRLNWSARLNYKITDNLNINWRTGHDVYFTDNFNTQNKGARSFPVNGFLEKSLSKGTIWDHTLQLNGNYKLNKDLDLSFQTGLNARQNKFESSFYDKQDQINFGVFILDNFSGNIDLGDFRSSQNQVGLFGQATLDYSNMLFLNVAVRSDWVSNLRKGFNNATYPSASISFLPTTAFKSLRSDNGLNYLKLRAGYGSSTRFPSGYPTDTNITQRVDDNTGLITNALNGNRDVEIKPEIVSEWEFGLEANFFRKRGSIDISYWDRRTEDIIGRASVAPSTGNQVSIPINTGTAKAKGIEFNLGYDIINSTNFTWNSRINFSAHEEILVERDDPFQRFGNNIPFSFGSFGNIASNAAIPGESLGTLVGTKIERDENGKPIVDSRGYYIIDRTDDDGNPHIVGDAIPDYRMNLINSFTYKNWNFSFMVHHTKGGDFYSQVPALLYGRGVTTGNLHEHGNTIVIDGVKSDGTSNDIAIQPWRYWHSNVAFGATELKIYDASLIRLQEVSLSYNFPEKFINKTPFSNLRLTAQGFNLWHKAYNVPDGINLDTNTVGPGIGNNRGIDYSNNAGSRRFGLTLRAEF